MSGVHDAPGTCDSVFLCQWKTKCFLYIIYEVISLGLRLVMTSLGQSGCGRSPMSASLIWWLPLSFMAVLLCVNKAERKDPASNKWHLQKWRTIWPGCVCLSGVKGLFVYSCDTRFVSKNFPSLLYITVKQLLKWLTWLFVVRQPCLMLYLQKCNRFSISLWNSPCTVYRT